VHRQVRRGGLQDAAAEARCETSGHAPAGEEEVAMALATQVPGKTTDPTKTRSARSFFVQGFSSSCLRAFVGAAFSVLSAFSAVSATSGAPQRGAPPAPPVAPRAGAPIDLTGYWVSLVTDDWRWRMVTPPKGDVLYLPVNAEGRRAAEAWDPVK